MEKQQQLALLQELEEQKAQLEQMLQEAQREREQLRAAAQQEALPLQPQVPVQDRSPISLTSEEEVGPASLNRMLVELLQHIPLKYLKCGQHEHETLTPQLMFSYFN